MHAILTVGISASGKSTWAAEYIYNNPTTTIINLTQRY
jgi:predicted kinase